MKQRSIHSFLFIVCIALLFAGCQDDSLIQDNVPPSTNQVSPPGSSIVAYTDSPGLIPNQYIVVFKDQWEGEISEQAAEEARALTNTILAEFAIPQDSVQNRYEYALKGFTARMSDQVKANLENDPRIDYITQDAKAKFIHSTTSAKPSPVRKSIQSGQTTPWGISRVRGPFDGTGKTAWVLDTGVDLDHPDLNVNTTQSASFIAEESADDENGHGTRVAGVLAAIDNDRDVVGVAAGATVVSVKVADQNGNTEVSIVTDGVDYISGKASTDDIVNMSGGIRTDTTDTQPLDDAVVNAANAGIRFAMSAGNDGIHADDDSPGRVEHSNVWTMSAYDDTDTFWEHSNFGNPPIEYGGPGVDVLSLGLGGGALIRRTGTSYAAPHIAGLLLAAPQGIATDGTVSNDPDGNPDLIAVAAQLTVTISGPSTLEIGQQGTWTANAEHAPGPISYQWYYTDNSTSSWIADGTDSDTYSHTFFETSDSATSQGVRVVVTSGSEEAEDILYVTVIDDDCDPSTELCEN